MNILKNLPNVNSLKNLEELNTYKTEFGSAYVTDVVREVLDEYRNGIIKGSITSVDKVEILNLIINNLNKQRYTLQHVINATGTIIHTNLGRSVLSKNSIENIVNVLSGYSNAEYDIDLQKRGDRYQSITSKLCELTGAEDAIVVNNNAAAILLVLTSLVTNGEAIISRGELIEIGGSFRVPEIMKFSNTTLCEVGTTNRTHIKDYTDAINEYTKAILKIHTSNYKIVGFTSSVDVGDIAKIAKDNNVISIEDIGSGSLVNFKKYCDIDEPTIIESINKGVDVVTFSGDKLLGSVQAGFIVGKKKYLKLIRENNLLRSLRVDKITLAAIEASLSEYTNEKEAINSIPTLKMITENAKDVKLRAEILCDGIKNSDFSFSIEESNAVVGGGSLPTETVDSYKVIVNGNYNLNKLYKELHDNNIPIITKVENDKIILDMKTVFEDDIKTIQEFFNRGVL